MSEQEGAEPGSGRRAEIALRVAGTVVGLLLGFVTALWEIFASPLHAGRIPLPVSPVLAVLTNLALVWFTRRITGRKGLAVLPGVVWFATMVVAANRTREGDLLLPGNDYMGLVAILIGGAAWGLAGYRMILVTPPPVQSLGAVRPTTVAPARKPASGPKPGAKPAPGPKPGAKPVRRPSGS
jgi:hypothetical protein